MGLYLRSDLFRVDGNVLNVFQETSHPIKRTATL